MTSSNGSIYRVTGPLCGNSPATGEFPSQRPVTRSFAVFFDLRLNKELSTQSICRWFKTPSRSLWRQCNVALLWRQASCRPLRLCNGSDCQWLMKMTEIPTGHVIPQPVATEAIPTFISNNQSQKDAGAGLEAVSLIVNWNKFQINCNENSKLFIQENMFENVVCEMAAILSWPHYIDSLFKPQCAILATVWGSIYPRINR